MSLCSVRLFFNFLSKETIFEFPANWLVENSLFHQKQFVRQNFNRLKMPFLGIIQILPKQRLILNFCAIFAGPLQAVKMAPKFKISLDFGRIQIVPKNNIFRYPAILQFHPIMKLQYKEGTHYNNVCVSALDRGLISNNLWNILLHNDISYFLTL